jgi:hypothetical protein
VRRTRSREGPGTTSRGLLKWRFLGVFPSYEKAVESKT